jgi:sugar O-acyltransferase (sialic acid O-acetyltransferase NeuD family)
MRRLYVIGTGGLAREMAQLALRIDPAQQKWQFSGYIGRDKSELGKSLPYGSVVGDDAWLAALDEACDVVLGIGYPKLRKDVVERLARNDRLSFPNVIHPTVEIDREWLRMGKGNVITKGCIFTCDVVLGDFNFFNWNMTVGHDCRLGSYNVVNPGSSVSGYSQLEDEILVGSGARILERRRISSRAVIGAGAVVTRDIVEEGVYIGIPARRRVGVS